MSEQQETPRPPAKRTAAHRVLSLLEAFSVGGGALTLSEISRHADLSLTTTHRLVREVLEWGGLDIDTNGRYRLSRKILNLASSSTHGMHLRETALPHLIRLHRQTGLTVHLSVRDGRHVMYLEALRPHPNYTGENRIGGRLKLHITATGLVLLAHAHPSVVEEYVRVPLKRYTPDTITDPAELRRELAQVRQRGYAIAAKSVATTMGSVAAPVRNAAGHVIAAVGSVYRVGNQDPQVLVRHVLLTANRISRDLDDRNSRPHPQTIDFNRRHAGIE